MAAAGVRKLVRFEDSERAVVKVGRLPVEGEAAEGAAVSAAGVKGDAARTAAEKAALADSAAEMKGDVAKTAAEQKAERAEAETAAEKKRELEWDKREAEMEIVIGDSETKAEALEGKAETCCPRQQFRMIWRWGTSWSLTLEQD